MKLSIPRICLITLTCCLVSTPMSAEEKPELAGVPELLAMPEPPADARFPYGDDPLQFADLRLPEGEGPFPVAVLVHGGCWLAEYDIKHLGAMADDLTRHGIATWTLEFRRIGNEGGGWPGTFLDVANGADRLRDIAEDYPLDLDRVVIAGHSAGGHLALWLAARHKLPPDSPLYLPDPLQARGVIGLAPAADLELTHRNQTCSGAAERLVGGTPEEYPLRYQHGSASELLPLGLEQLIINGAHDEGWLIVSRAYQEKARAAGEEVPIIVPPDAGHFELVMPTSTTFPVVREAIVKMAQ
ncbi:alpha/beta hydrolase family protein [Elongatibacter sediminis]|uniref:Alpha/beta hydrolase n=1 Tax=Elongatibacter sediminis TaxID=3119006 RepID=A0AAW9R6Z4_9GAMM